MGIMKKNDGPDRLTKRAVIARIVESHLATPILYTDACSWYSWNEKHWELERDKSAVGIQRLLLDANCHYLAALSNEADKELRACCLKLDDSPNALVNLAKTLSAVACSNDQFDRQPYLFYCANGTLDLRNGQLAAHSRNDFLTRISPIGYDPAATCPRFDRFLWETFDGDQELIEYVVRMLGYCLTGDTSEQKFWIWYGPAGQNGKSVLANIVRELLGHDYASEVSPKTLCGSEKQIPNDIARLGKCRFLSCREPDLEARLNESLLKSLVGQDIVVARFLFKEFFEFRPQFKLLMQTNHLPRANASSDAIWRRIRVIPFNVRVADRDRKKNLARELVESEGPGILSRLVRGAMEHYKHGLSEPVAVTKATAAYREAQRLLDGISNTDSTCGQHFIVTHVQPSSGHVVTKAELYQAYEEHCRENGVVPVSEKAFGMAMKRAGYEHPHVQNFRVRQEDGEMARAWYGAKVA